MFLQILWSFQSAHTLSMFRKGIFLLDSTESKCRIISWKMFWCSLLGISRLYPSASPSKCSFLLLITFSLINSLLSDRYQLTTDLYRFYTFTSPQRQPSFFSMLLCLMSGSTKVCQPRTEGKLLCYLSGSGSVCMEISQMKLVCLESVPLLICSSFFLLLHCSSSNFLFSTISRILCSISWILALSCQFCWLACPSCSSSRLIQSFWLLTMDLNVSWCFWMFWLVIF